MRKHSLATGIMCVLVFLPAIASASFDTNLQFGARGPAVVELQQFLISRGLLTSDSATGYFGPLTLAAVKAFQSSQGVQPVSGFFGPLTRARANAFSSSGSASAPSQSADMSVQIAALLQQIANLQAQIAGQSSGNTAQTNTINTGPSISVSTNGAGKTIVNGNPISISWNSQMAPAGYVVNLSAVADNGSVSHSVATNQVASGSSSWTVDFPAQNTGCTETSPSPCLTNGSYHIEARLFSPQSSGCSGTVTTSNGSVTCTLGTSALPPIYVGKSASFNLVNNSVSCTYEQLVAIDSCIANGGSLPICHSSCSYGPGIGQ